MKSQLHNLKKKYSIAQKYFKSKKMKYFCVTITTNTSKGEKKTYLPPLREIGKTLIFGVVVYSTEQLKKICQVFDNDIAAIFVDRANRRSRH